MAQPKQPKWLVKQKLRSIEDEKFNSEPLIKSKWKMEDLKYNNL